MASAAALYENIYLHFFYSLIRMRDESIRRRSRNNLGVAEGPSLLRLVHDGGGGDGDHGRDCRRRDVSSTLLSHYSCNMQQQRRERRKEGRVYDLGLTFEQQSRLSRF